MEMLAEALNKSFEECYDEFGKTLIERYGSLYDAFEDTAYDPDSLENEGFQGDWVESFKQIAQDNIAIQFVDIKGYLDVRSWKPDGIVYIRDSLAKAEESEFEDVTIEVHYLGAPHFSVTVTAPDYKIAEEEMKKAVARAEEEIIKHGGELTFHRKIDE